MATSEREFHAHRGQPAQRSSGKFTIPDDDQVPSFHQYDEAQLWTVDAYDERRAKQMVAQGCQPLPSTQRRATVRRDYPAADTVPGRQRRCCA